MPRRILTALAVLIGALLAYVGYTFCNANFHTIVSGEAYRSGQMDAAQLSRAIQEYGIKSIINLRGTTDAPALYQGEMETAKRLGVAVSVNAASNARDSSGLLKACATSALSQKPDTTTIGTNSGIPTSRGAVSGCARSVGADEI